jgi:hypothetical protein
MLGRKREPLREVEPEVIPPEPLSVVSSDQAPAPEPEPVPLAPAPAQHLPTPLREEPSDNQTSPPPSVSTERWSCEIALWTDQDRGVFYARSFRRGEELIVAESSGFAVTGELVEESPEAVAAYQSLCDDLVRMGWTREGNGPEWYGARFGRDFSVAALNASLTSQAGSERRQY